MDPEWVIGGLGPAPLADPNAERILLDLAGRAPRRVAGWSVLVLHLSRLAAPGPRPQHRQIAHTILQDTARRLDGQFLALRNGDLLVLCRSAALGSRGADPSDGSIPATLSWLLLSESGAGVDPGSLVSIWDLEKDSEQLRRYAAALLPEGMPLPSGDQPAAPGPGGSDTAGRSRAAASIIAPQGGRASDLMQRQTAILLNPGADGPALRPLFQELSFSIPAVEGQAGLGPSSLGPSGLGGHPNAGAARSDPFLFRHLATRLDQAMMEALQAARGDGGPLDTRPAASGAGRIGLNVNMTVAGLLSDGFAALLRARADAPPQRPIGIEVPLIEAAADPSGFSRARRLVAEAGMRLLLDGVSHVALALTRPQALHPNMMKLDWSPAMAALPAEADTELTDSITAIGSGRIVLQRADSEASLRWGLSRGIRRFQGRHVDAILAASRIGGCARAADCRLPQCLARAASLAIAVRRGCGNTALLDAAMPSAMTSAA